ncbi:MAG TPA: DUF4129 domain-containing protein [Gaiellaceae bacterium]
MLQRRTVLLAVVVTLLLAVVAIVAGGRPAGSSGSGHGGLPGSFWDYLYTTIVILAVPLVVAGVVGTIYFRLPRRKPRPLWQSMLQVLVIYAVVVALELLIVRHLHFHRQATQQAGSSLGQSGQHHGRHPATGNPAVRFQWDELVVVLGLILVIAVAAVVALRRSRADHRRPDETAPEALAAALDESLDDLRTDPDLRRAIIAAYARMETALAAAGIPRRPSEAPLEYLERALLALDASADAVRELTDLFEWARFSHHEPEPSMRDEAVDALVAVRDELRAAELAPA